jgi:hypothetical protein
LELCQDILPLLTAEPAAMKQFIQDGGDAMLVEKFLGATNDSKMMAILATLMNLVVSSDSTTLETKFAVYSKLMPKLKVMIVEENDWNLMVLSHAIALFILLYRASSRYRRVTAIPLDAIFRYISMKSSTKFPDAAIELWYLILLGKLY